MAASIIIESYLMAFGYAITMGQSEDDAHLFARNYDCPVNYETLKTDYAEMLATKELNRRVLSMKFRVGDSVRVVGSTTTGIVIGVNYDDDEFPYEVEFVGKDYNLTDVFAEYNIESARTNN